MMKFMWKSLFSPRLIKVYDGSALEKMYEPNTLESIGDKVIKSIYFMWKFGVYTSPLLAGYLYRRGYFEKESCIMLTKIGTLIGGIIVVSYVIRSIGRLSNPVYREFLLTLDSVTEASFKGIQKQNLSKYDFEFFAWPVEFRYNNLSKDDIKSRIYINSTQAKRGIMQIGSALPCNIIAYLAIHTFGIKIIYPGSIGVVNNLLHQNLVQGRSKLVIQDSGKRYKLETKDKNEIDAMFVDRRGKNSLGNTLVICCEGNCGFYEIGIMVTPITAGYSVLGWNHPGFSGSTGTPFPTQELNAMDAVMQFAVNELGFKLENILLFGWSIGGFPASWAAMNYPNIKGIILDATFDDVMPLALNVMPSWFEPIVRIAIREHVNLNIIEQLAKFPGPISIVRRTEDEVICTEFGDLSTNRGNNLLMKLLKYRYPFVFEDRQETVVSNYLAINSVVRQEDFVNSLNIRGEECNLFINRFMSDHPKEYPSRLGSNLDNDEFKTKLAIVLLRKYLKDYKGTHCVPLPVDLFQIPWEVEDFVFT